MNKILRKLFISIITVIVAVIALGTTTFAWFTLTNVASISNFEAQVRTEKGIEISLDGENWVNTLTANDIWTQLDKDGFKKFNHVTSVDGMTFKTLNEKHDQLIDAPASDYISLRIYFKAIDIEKINLTELILTGIEETWTVDTGFLAKGGLVLDPKDDDNKTIQVNPIDAIRISIIKYVDLELDEDIIVAYEKGNTTTNTYISDWSQETNPFPAYGAYSYYVAKKGSEPVEWSTKALVKTTALDAFSEIEVLAFTGNEEEHMIGSIQLNIWFEGYDPEGYNALLSKLVSISLEFEGE